MIIVIKILLLEFISKIVNNLILETEIKNIICNL